MEASAGLARCLAALGQADDAYELAKTVWGHVSVYGTAGMESPIRIYGIVADIFDGAGHSEDSRAAVQTGYRDMMARADKITRSRMAPVVPRKRRRQPGHGGALATLAEQRALARRPVARLSARAAPFAIFSESHLACAGAITVGMARQGPNDPLCGPGRETAGEQDQRDEKPAVAQLQSGHETAPPGHAMAWRRRAVRRSYLEVDRGRDANLASHGIAACHRPAALGLESSMPRPPRYAAPASTQTRPACQARYQKAVDTRAHFSETEAGRSGSDEGAMDRGALYSARGDVI